MLHRLDRYLPIVVVFFTSLIMGVAISISHLDFNFTKIMTHFMGVFFCIVSMLKLFDLEGFVDQYVEYDLLSIRNRNYAYAYPFVELGLGVLFILQFFTLVLSFLAAVLMVINAVGVIRGLSHGKKLRSATLGTGTSTVIPLNAISLFENVIIGGIASIHILQTLQ